MGKETNGARATGWRDTMVATSRNQEPEGAKVLRLSVTGQCNLSCFYCRPLGRSTDLFEAKTLIQPSDVTKLVRIVGELGVTKVIIGGGEPLLRKDAAGFVKSAMAHRGISEVRLVTNGVYLKAFGDELRKNGLRKVDINVDTLNYEKFHRVITKRDDLFRVLDGIDKVEKLNFPDVRINILLMNGLNHDELVDFARLTKNRKLHLRMMEYHPETTNGDPLAERRKLSVLDAKRSIDNFQKLHQIHDLEAEFPHPTFKFADGIGKISFLSEIEIAAEAAVPSVLFNADGVFSNELVPGKTAAVLEELRRDAKQDQLRRTIEKILHAHVDGKRKPQPATRKPASVSSMRGRAGTTARHAAARR